jgi:hypothetical protein
VSGEQKTIEDSRETMKAGATHPWMPRRLTRPEWKTYIDQLRQTLPKVLLEKVAFVRWSATSDDRKSSLKVNKIPFPHYNRPDAFLTFGRACEYVPGVCGLGIANVEQDFTIFDIDDQVTKFPWPGPDLDSSVWWGYWEMSPSGRGKRGFALGRLPQIGASVARLGGIEVYRDKWATLTGQPCPLAVCPRGGFDREVLPLSADLVAQWLSFHKPHQLPAEETAEVLGPWNDDILEERLRAWEKFIPDFQFWRIGEKFSVPCPGAHPRSWPNGDRHSDDDPRLSRAAMCWVRNGLPVFHCFHAHCTDKTWKDFQKYYDPDKLWHTIDDAIESEVIRMQGGEFKCRLF